ncbi:MAG TPA: hypothetical protein V6C81_05035 [Planktothrix sp.]|jgi:hypothetical protein
MKSYFVLMFASMALGLYGGLAPDCRRTVDLRMKLGIASSVRVESETIRDLIKFDGRGCIFSVEDDNPDPAKVWRPTVDFNEILRAVQLYVPGRNPAEILSALGQPRFKETRVSFAGCPGSVEKSQEVWLYSLGPSGWGCTFAIYFENTLCTGATVLSIDQEFAYEAWQCKAISTYAPNRTTLDIRQRFGPPDRIDKTEDGERWSYDILDSEGVWLQMNHSAICTGAENYDIFH